MATISLRTYNKEIDGLIDNHQFKEAIAHCRHILKKFPKHLDTYRLLGKAFLEEKRYTEALDVLQRVLSSLPDDFISQVGMSMIREDEGNLDAAIFHMERAFETQPANTAVQGELKRLYGRRDGMLPGKIRLTRGALVRMYARGDLFQQAIAEARVALKEQPDRVDIEVILARMYLLSGQKVSATEVSSRLVEALPYCFEANRILAEVLPGTSRDEDATVYRQRLIALDPYLSQAEVGAVDSTTVPDDAVMVDIFEGDFEAEAETQSDWVESVGAKTELPEDEPLPDWLTSVEISDQPTEQSIEKGQDWENLPIDMKPGGEASPADSTPPEEEIPDWMRAAGWQTASGEPVPGSTSDENLAQAADELATNEGELPDWLQEIAPEDETLEPDEVKEEPATDEDNTWLESILADAQQKAEGLSGAELVAPEEYPEKTVEAIPSEDMISTPVGDQSPEAAGDSEPPEVETAGTDQNIPDWLKSLTEEEKGGEILPAVETEGDDDWLNLLHPEEMADAASQDIPAEPAPIEIPDETGLPEEPFLAAGTLAGAALEEPESSERSSDIEVPAQTETEAETPPAAFQADFIDEKQTEPGKFGEEIFASDLVPEPTEGSAAEEPLPEGFLTAMNDVNENEPASEPDFLAETEKSSPPEDDSTQPTRVHTEEYQSAPVAPIYTGETEITEPKTPTPPFEEMAVSGEVSPVTDKTEGAETSGPALVMADDEDLSIFDLNLPEEEPPLGEADLAALEAFRAEDANVPDWLKESLDQVPDENLGETSQPAIVEAGSEGSDQTPAQIDDDTAFAWLESLAARQGADEETLQVAPEDRLEEPPEWVKAETEAVATDQEPMEAQAAAGEAAETPQDTTGDLIPEEAGQASAEGETPADLELQPETKFPAWLAEESIGDKSIEETSEPAEEPLPDWLKETLQEGEFETTGNEEPERIPEESIAQVKDEWLPEEAVTESKDLAFTTGEVQTTSDFERSSEPETIPESELGTAMPEEAADITPAVEEPAPVTPPNVKAEEAITELEPEITGKPEAEEVPEWLQGLAEEMPASSENTSLLDSEAPPDWLKDLEGEESGLLPDVATFASLRGTASLPPLPEEQPVSPCVEDTSPIRITPAAAEKPSDGSDLYNAQSAFQGQNVELALEYYNRLISRGEALEDTIHDLRDALYRYPVDVSIWQTLGDAYARSNQLQEALDAYTKAEELLR